MNTGQMLLTLGAMVLLSILVLKVNNTQLSTQDTMVTSKMGLMGISLATSYIEEANKLAFDAASVDNFVSSLSKLTSAGALGPAYGEYYPDFNDFDDFNGLNRIDTIPNVGIFDISCTVSYISPQNPDVAISSKSWHKKLTINLTSDSMTDTLHISSIFSYWKDI